MKLETGKDSYEVLPDVARMLQINMLSAKGDVLHEIRVVPPGEMSWMRNKGASGTPIFASILGGYLVFYPKPNKDYEVSCRYVEIKEF